MEGWTHEQYAQKLEAENAALKAELDRTKAVVLEEVCAKTRALAERDAALSHVRAVHGAAARFNVEILKDDKAPKLADGFQKALRELNGAVCDAYAAADGRPACFFCRQPIVGEVYRDPFGRAACKPHKELADAMQKPIGEKRICDCPGHPAQKERVSRCPVHGA